MSDSGNYRPQMFGYGTSSRFAWGGGSDPAVIPVTNLNDSGSGSLREALLTPGPRVVVFEISGTIVLSSDIYVVEPWLTIAGQTAPSPGITLRGYGIWVYTNGVISQHFRIRPGDVGDTDTGQGIRAGVYEDLAYDIVLDHMSISWCNDESTIVAKTAAGDSGTSDANVTFWRCLVAEGLNFTAREPSSEGKGLAVNYNSKQVSAIQNLYVNMANRLPFVKGGTEVYFSNNLVHNWAYNIPALFVDPVEDDIQNGPFFVDLIGNHYRAGPNWDSTGAYLAGSRYAQSGSQLFLSDNIRDVVSGTLNEFINIQNEGIDPRVGSPTLTPPTGHTPMAASLVQANIVPNAGARPLDRDSVDTRLVNDVTNRTGDSAIQSQDQVGGWPTLAVNTQSFSIPSNPHSVAAGQSFRTNLEMTLEALALALEPGVDVSPSLAIVLSSNSDADIDGTEDVPLLEKLPTDNFDTRTRLYVAYYAPADGGTGLIRFPGLVGCVPVGYTLASATLRLNAETLIGPAQTISVYRQLRAWVVGEATWEEYASGVPWAEPGGVGLGTDRVASVSMAFTTPDTGQWVEATSVDFTEEVRLMAIGAVSNNGWHLERSGGANDERYVDFWGSEGDDGVRPELVLTLTIDAEEETPTENDARIRFRKA